VTTMDIERRVFAPLLRMVDLETSSNLQWLTGRAVPYNTWTSVRWYQEAMAPGVFDKSLDEAARGLPLLLFHDGQRFPIGVSDKWKSVKSDGLHGVWRLDDDPDAQRAAKLARDGLLTGLSVGFVPLRNSWEITDDEEWNPDDVSTLDKCTRLEARLVETSLVSTPAYAAAEVLTVRTAERRAAVRAANLRKVAAGTPSLDTWRSWRASIS